MLAVRSSVSRITDSVVSCNVLLSVCGVAKNAASHRQAGESMADMTERGWWNDGEHGTTLRYPDHYSHLAHDTQTRAVALYGQRNMLEECRCSVEAPRVGRSITAR